MADAVQHDLGRFVGRDVHGPLALAMRVPQLQRRGALALFVGIRGWANGALTALARVGRGRVTGDEAAASFDPPRTPDGRPDFNGTWVLPGGQTGGPYEDLEAHPRTRDNLGGPATVVDPPNNR